MNTDSSFPDASLASRPWNNVNIKSLGGCLRPESFRLPSKFSPAGLPEFNSFLRNRSTFGLVHFCPSRAHVEVRNEQKFKPSAEYFRSYTFFSKNYLSKNVISMRTNSNRTIWSRKWRTRTLLCGAERNNQRNNPWLPPSGANNRIGIDNLLARPRLIRPRQRESAQNIQRWIVRLSLNGSAAIRTW